MIFQLSTHLVCIYLMNRHSDCLFQMVNSLDHVIAIRFIKIPLSIMAKNYCHCYDLIMDHMFWTSNL